MGHQGPWWRSPELSLATQFLLGFSVVQLNFGECCWWNAFPLCVVPLTQFISAGLLCTPKVGQQVLSCKAAHRHVSKTHPTCNIKINKIFTLYFEGHQSDSTDKRKTLFGAHRHRTSRGFYCDWLLIQQVTKLFITLQNLKLLDFFILDFHG